MGFNEKAKDWDKDPKKTERARIFAGEILDFTGDKNLTNAIEFGSGTGLVSFQLKDRFRSITLADNSTGMMEVLKEKIRNENITNMKPFLIDSENDLGRLTGFDVIFTLLTLHHIKDIDKLLSAFNASLNRGGYVFIGDLVTEDGSFHSNDPDFDGHKGFEREMLKNRLALKGFITEADKIFMEMEKETNGILKKYPLFFIAGKKL
jgi:2-polyprenyl-3-methyl-5-hydroxy-6-metoxy-1,4-benzoquinol methylase